MGLQPSNRYVPFRKRRLLFRVVALAYLAYLIIAVLHGVSPELWDRYTEDPNYEGAFRLLMFSPVLAVCFLLLLLQARAVFSPQLSRHIRPATRPVRFAWSRRAPPPLD